MTDSHLHQQLRNATESDVEKALADAWVALPIADPAAALEFFNRMLDVIIGDEDFVEIPRLEQ